MDPPTKRPRIDFADTFLVKVGASPTSKTYTLPTKTFAARSNFFKAGLSSRWRSEDLPIELKDVKIEDFETYMHCVTYNEVDVDVLDEDIWDKMGDLYVLSDRLLDPRSANLVIDVFVRDVGAADVVPDARTLSRIYNNTVPGSPLRTLAIDWALHEWPDETEDESLTDDLPREMLLDILREYRRLKDVNGNREKRLRRVLCVRASERQKCHYNQHDEDHPKCK